MIRIGDSGIRARKSWSPQHLHKICSANFLVNPLICFDRMVDSAQVGLVAPRWIRDWLANPTASIDLDAAYASGAG
jgi:hypothetical protein